MQSPWLHFCEFNDGDLIDERDAEFLSCRCFEPTTEFLELQDRIAVKLDAERSSEIPL